MAFWPFFIIKGVIIIWNLILYIQTLNSIDISGLFMVFSEYDPLPSSDQFSGLKKYLFGHQGYQKQISSMKLCMKLSLYITIQKNIVWLKKNCTSKEQIWENQKWPKWPILVKYKFFDGNEVKMSIFRYTDNFLDISQGLDPFPGWEIFKLSFLFIWD